jgi:hypothetical protein
MPSKIVERERTEREYMPRVPCSRPALCGENVSDMLIFRSGYALNRFKDEKFLIERYYFIDARQNLYRLNIKPLEEVVAV